MSITCTSNRNRININIFSFFSSPSSFPSIFIYEIKMNFRENKTLLFTPTYLSKIVTFFLIIITNRIAIIILLRIIESYLASIMWSIQRVSKSVNQNKTFLLFFFSANLFFSASLETIRCSESLLVLGDCVSTNI